MNFRFLFFPRGGIGLFSSAGLAIPIDFQFVIQNVKSFLPRDLILESLQTIVFEFGDFPTFPTDQVIVMFALGPLLKTSGTFAKLPGGRPPALCQQTQRAVHRRIPDAWVSLTNLPVQFINRYMRSGFPQRAHDLVPLTGGLETPFPKQAAKGIFG
jgi:hypothetical protein